MVVGRILGPFGVHGEIKVEVLTDYPERFQAMDMARLGQHHTEWPVTGIRFHGQRVLMRLEGVDTPESVRPLQHQEISVPRSEAVPLPEGHYYLADVLGLLAMTPEGDELGTVTEVLRTGSNDVFVVGKGRGEILVPAINDAVRELDIAGGKLVVEPWILSPEAQD
jgi:16S rRNA processing protein RimM